MKKPFINHIAMRVALLTMLLMPVGGYAAAQDGGKGITVAMENTDLKSVIWQIERQSGITFIYNGEDIEKARISSVRIENKSVEEALALALKDTGFEVEKRNGTYVLIKSTSTQRNDRGRVAITGKVGDRQGEPLSGATVLLKGTTVWISTLADGSYTLHIPEESLHGTLVFSCIGMSPLEVPINNRTSISVMLENDLAQIENVIVTGYGNIVQDYYTGSATVLSASKIGDRAISSFEGALRGVLPGAMVSSTGQPGQEMEILLRGIGSMNAGNQPLYVVDGVVWDQVNMSGNENTPSNPLNTLNPNDIANITTLKDAASAALYGSRGANGVIVVTTKKGAESDRVNFTLNLQAGVSHMNAHPSLVNGSDYAGLWTEGKFHSLVQQEIMKQDGLSGTNLRNALVSELTKLYGDKDGYTFNGKNFNEWYKLARMDFNALFKMPNSDGSYTYYDYFGDDHDKLPSTDWFREISRVAPFIKANLQLQGGSKSINYFSSMEYLNQQGTIINSELKRYALRIKLGSDSDRQLVNWNLNTYMASTSQSGPLAGGQAYNSPHYAALLLPSVITPKLEDGSYNFYFPNNLLNSNHNPLASARENINEKPQMNINVIGGVKLNLTDWLKFSSTGSLYYLGLRRKAYYNSEFGTGYSGNGELTERDVHRRKLTNTNMFFIEKAFRSRHRINISAGTELENLDYRYTQFTVKNFITNDHPNAGNGSVMDGWDGGGYGYSMFSLISKADYSYRYRYFVSGSFRQDRSSRFHPDYRTGNFWSVSGAYRITNEPFMKRFSGWLDLLRFKGSYGVNGTLPAEYYSWRNALTAVEYMSEAGAVSIDRSNRELTWEGNRIWNVAMDTRFLGNRVGFSIEYYDRRSSNLLQDVDVSLTSGYATMLMNTDAGIHSRGIEIDLNGRPVETENFKWDINFNLSTLKSTYYGLKNPQLDRFSRQIMENGADVYSWYLRESAGVDPETGLVMYAVTDEEGNRSVSSASTDSPLKIVGSGLPKISGGITQTLSYKNWTLSLLFSYAWGHYIYDRVSASITANDGAYLYAIAESQLDRWTPDNLNASAPLRVNDSDPVTRSTRYLVKGDYIKLKNVQLRYTLPQRAVDFLKLKSVTVFLQAENPLRLAYLKDYDPEMSLTGYRYTDAYPTAAIYTAGVTMNF